jgi:integrase
LPIGTSGKVRTYRTETGWRARTTFRDYDGRTREVQQHGRTKAEAERRLAEALRDRRTPGTGSELTGESKVALLAERWFAEISGGTLSPNTVSAYRDRLDRQILPALASVRVRELSVGLVDRHLNAIKTAHGAAVAKMTKSVLSGMCGLACRHNALASNPCRDVSRISTQPLKPPTSLTVDEVRQLHEWLSADAESVARDLPDLVMLLAATGLRIGEALGLRWCDVDLDHRTLSVTGTVVRLRPGGLMIKPSTKSVAGQRILELPTWAGRMLHRRASERTQRQMADPVFPAVRSGGLRDPSNTLKMLRRSFQGAGFGGVTSHQFRKTVGTIMDDAGLSARRTADQLGHSKPSMTQDKYLARRARATGAAEVLEDLFPGTDL